MSQHRTLRRPHSSATFLSSFFKKLSHMYNHSSFHNFSEQYQPIRDFEEKLTQQLESLKPKEDDLILNLEWLEHALGVGLEVHKQAEDLIPTFQFPLSECDEKWTSEYLDDTMKILDICNALLANISEMQLCQLLVRHATHTLGTHEKILNEDDLMRARKSLNEWTETLRSKNLESAGKLERESCSALLQSVSNSLKVPNDKAAVKGKGFLYALYGAKAIIIFVCSMLALAVSRETEMSSVRLYLSDKFLWSTSIVHWLQLAKEEARQHISDGSALCFHEFNNVQSSVTELIGILDIFLRQGGFPLNIEQADRLALAVQEVRSRLDAFVNGLDQVEKKLNNFFHTIIASRSVLLDHLGDPSNVNLM